MIGRVLNNRYEILEQIGRGGMAYVYKARDRKLNRLVAVKVLREEYTENEQFIKKFDRESQAAAGLTHPNIVSVYDVGVEPDSDLYYIVMEFVDGITLKQYLNKKGRLDYKEATRFVIDIANAIKCAHEHKIIHRDIKPHNILLTKDLVPKVADFGIARAITSSTVTMTNQTMGSVHYISPEQARGGFVDERSDLYSLGILYYELITGTLPFDDESTVSIAIKHIQDEIVPPKELEPQIPQAVNDIILRLTEKKPEDRYQSTDDLIHDLELVLADSALAMGGFGLQESSVMNTESLFRVEPVDEESYDDYADEDYYEEDLADQDEKKKNGKKKTSKGKIIAAVVLGLLLIGGAVVIFADSLFGKRVYTPNIVGMTVEEGTKKCQEAGLTLEVESEVNSADVEVGKIVSQSPSASSESRSGKAVKVTVSKGPKMVIIPDIKGKTEKEATAELEKQKLKVEIKREKNNEIASGIVYQIEPGEGVSIAEGKTVTIWVSQGRDVVNVPGIVSMSEGEAANAITSHGLVVGTVTYQESDFPSGVVISQSPTEGIEVDRGTAVNYVVSSGRPQPSPSPTPEPTPSPTAPTTPSTPEPNPEP